MSIESHYNDLRTRAEDAESIVSAAEDQLRNPETAPAVIVRDANMSFDAVTALQADVIAEMNEHSQAQWPSVRASIAGAGEPLPNGPSTYDYCGVVVCDLGNHTRICRRQQNAGREREPIPYLSALASLLPRWRLAADHARSTYERYRNAVVQGVALDPEGKVPCDSAE